VKIDIKKIKTAFRKFWEKYEAKIVVIIGLILVAIISFEAGIMKGQEWQKKPLIIEKPAEMVNSAKTPENSLGTQNSASESTQNEAVAGESTKKNCAFVGSKNSDKYHAPTCTWATRIKAENRVCFSDIEEAKSKGYVAGSCLKK